MVRSWGTLACLVLAVVACGEDESGPAPTPSTAIAPTLPMSMDAGRPPPADAGNKSTAVEPRTIHRFASASAMLTALNDDAADGGVVLRGMALFGMTTEGVDYEVELQGCAGEHSYPMSILEASDCSPASVRGPVWADKRGDGLPALFCAGTGAGQAGAAYERSATRRAPWTIGDGAVSDVLGHALVVHDMDGTPLACGVIARAPDKERAELPPDDQPPTLEARAVIGGACLARQFAGSTSECPDSRALVSCEALHCDLAGCLDTCASYTSCLDQQSDSCSVTNGCELTLECSTCMGQMQECSLYYCAEHAFCGANPSPDGPCARMAGCCALQGSGAAGCLSFLVQFLAGLGGDANCVASMMDWDVISHVHVPCTFGPGEPAGALAPEQPANSAPQLAEGRAGASCESDADCAGGNCARAAADGGGYCTRACATSSQCGSSGLCVGGQSSMGKQCLARCVEQSDCREGFVCTGRMAGARISQDGVCSPKRQADQLADNVAGRACQSDSECSGGQCAKTNLLGASYPGNYCTARCYEDSHCGQGSVCMWTQYSAEPGYCLQACESDSDCTREDYGCWELGGSTRTLHACYPLQAPLPDGRTGQACTNDTECGAPHATCAKELPYVGLVTNDVRPAPGGYCTQRCALDRECGRGAQCINSGTSGGMCLASCSSTSPCREGYVCFAHSRDNDEQASVCVVPATVP